MNILSVGTPEAATLGANSTAMPIAEPSGPSFGANGPIPPNGAVFPLFQTVLKTTSDNVIPASQVNKAGASLTVVSGSLSPSAESQFRLTIPSLGIDQSFTFPSSMVSGLLTQAHSLKITDSPQLSLFMTVYGLNYVEFGSWKLGTRTYTAGTYSDVAYHHGAFATGYQTPANTMPTSGRATYAGVNNVTGLVVHSGLDSTPCCIAFPNSAALRGDASFTADFRTGSLTGTFSNMEAIDYRNEITPWNNVSVSAAIAGGTSQFSGSTAPDPVTTSNAFTLNETATGHINGAFYGPNAEELGAVWSLSSGDGTRAAIGAVGAKR